MIGALSTATMGQISAAQGTLSKYSTPSITSLKYRGNKTWSVELLIFHILSLFIHTPKLFNQISTFFLAGILVFIFEP